MGLISRVSSRTYSFFSKMALFQTQSKSTSRAPQTNYLAEIKCGRMTMNESTKMVEPQLEKGLLFVKQMNDTLIHLVWKERGVTNSKIPEDDLIVFEGDCSVRLIKQLPDRVFLVRWNQTNTRKIYWMQHTDKAKDEELIKDLDLALNNTSEAQKKYREKIKKETGGKSGAEKGGASGGLDLGSLMGEAGSSEILSQLMQSGALDQNTMNSLLQQMGGAGIGGGNETAAETPKSSRPASTKANNGGKGVDAADLQQAFGMVNQKKSYDLTKVLGSESLVGMLSNKEVQERLNKHMPKDEKIKETKEELRAAVGSPQYQQAVQAFQEALESGQLAPVLQQFNLPENAIKAAAGGDMKAFAEAMEGANKKKSENDKNESSTPKPKEEAEKKDDKKEDEKDNKDDEDEKMAVD